MSSKILITGATGATGHHAIESLLQLNYPIRAMVHKTDERSQRLEALGVEIVEADLLDFDSVRSALKDIEKAYFVYPVTTPGLIDATAYFIEAAIEAGVDHVVNMSQISARKDATSHAAQNHWIAEQIFDRSPIPVTHLRPTFFAEWLMYQAKAITGRNQIVLPFGKGRYAPIAAEDLGRVIASVLANPRDHIGKVYPLYGAVEVDEYEIAAILSEIIGKKIDYVEIPIEPFKEVMKTQMHATPYFIQHISSVAQDCRDGVFAGTNTIVKGITGHEPLTVGQYIQKNIHHFIQN